MMTYAVLGTPEEEEEVLETVEDSVEVAAPIEKEPDVAKISLLLLDVIVNSVSLASIRVKHERELTQRL